MSNQRTDNASRPTDKASRSRLPWRRINHLAGAFALGVVLTAAVFLTTPLGKQAPATPAAYETRQPSQAASHGTSNQLGPAAGDRRANGTDGSHAAAGGQRQPLDPQEQLRQIQAINDYNRRLTQPDIPGLPADPTAPRTPASHGPP